MEGATAELQHLLTTPPPGYTAAHHAHAILHASLEHIRNTGDERYLFLRAALETLAAHNFFSDTATTSIVNEEELLFHCVTGVRTVLLLRWDVNVGLREVIRDLMLQLGTGLYGILPRTVAMACLSCASAFYKRGWKDVTSTPTVGDQAAYLVGMIDNLTRVVHFPNEDNKASLFAYLNRLMVAPFGENSVQAQYSCAMASAFLSLLVGEFSGGNSSSRYNLPLEFHRSHHQFFENDGAKSGLDSTLDLSMMSLSNLVGYILNNTNGASLDEESFLEMSSSLISLSLDVISWEFGAGKSKWEFGTTTKEGAVLLRPPKRWREALINPDFLGAMFQVYAVVRVDQIGAAAQKRGIMAHQLRQLLLQLSSIALGPIFEDENEHGAYASFLLDGCLNVLEKLVVQQQRQVQQMEQIMDEWISLEVIDLVTILSRITTNFGVQTLSRLPTFQRFLSTLCTTGRWLLDSSLAECQNVKGDIECMESVDWKNDAIAQILQCSDAMGDDFWLVTGKRTEALLVSQALASFLAPLYGSYCMCRVQMSSMEEHYMAGEEADLDDIREEISALGLEEEMSSAASLGRLNILRSMTTLSGMFEQCIPKLMTLFSGPLLGSEMTPDVAALMEEARMLIVCACHLLTDECPGETPAIPNAVGKACKTEDGSANEQCIAAISGLVDMLMKVAEAQATRVSAYPDESVCSPLLSKTLLWFFNRWAAAYIFPTTDSYEQSGGIYEKWAKAEQAEPVINFCTTLCLSYFCHWPLEKEVQDESTSLLLALAKRGHFVRDLLVKSSSFEQIAALHICTPMSRNSAPDLLKIEAMGGNLSPELIKGYQRLPHVDRARILTCLLIGCSEMKHEKALNMLNGCLSAVDKSFKLLVHALESKQVHPTNINAQESAFLTISLYNGVALASEMNEPERISHFISPSLTHLSGLMKFDAFADDLSICGALLTFFRDYAEQCIGILDHQQCGILFTSAASLLKSYSEHHCQNRAIPRISEEIDFEEEQKYNDVLCAIQLLIHLGTKDFIDVFNADTYKSQGLGSENITDVIFFGLQQILPLMSQGLLQFPTLCTHYFSLVGFTVETHPSKMCVLPFDLFKSLLDSLLFGMSHSDNIIAKCSLQGLASLIKEHTKTNALSSQLSVKGDILQECTQRVIQEVVFQPIIWDRLEPVAAALLPLLVSIELSNIATLINTISLQSGSQDRLNVAFEKLIKPELLSKTALNGKEGRMIRTRFKTEFDAFVKDVQSFLVTR